MTEIPLKAKDFKSDQEVRWCPGCGDYAILAAVQSFLPELGRKPEDIVFVSGIGCSSRFPYYLVDLRSSFHPRTGPGHRHRPHREPSRSRRLGGHR